MRTSADEVSIHAVSPESTFRASSACASEASASTSTSASASDERTHQYPAAKDRCLLSIVPLVLCEEAVEQRWCHDLRQWVNRKPPGASAAARGRLPSFQAPPAFCAAPGRGGVAQPPEAGARRRRSSGLSSRLLKNSGNRVIGTTSRSESPVISTGAL